MHAAMKRFRPRLNSFVGSYRGALLEGSAGGGVGSWKEKMSSIALWAYLAMCECLLCNDAWSDELSATGACITKATCAARARCAVVYRPLC
jgi:hypothetical protein